MMLRRCALAAAVLLLAACAQVSKVADGDVVVRERLVVTVDTPWNQFERTMADKVPTWTNEGLTIDALQFFVAIKDGELISPTPSEPKGQRPLVFRAGMQAAEVVDLFQTLWTRDGSSLTIDKVAPEAFMGGNGFRIDYSRVRKVDEVRLQGVAWGVVHNGELYVIHYSAPRLAFFGRYLPRVEALAKTARARG